MKIKTFSAYFGMAKTNQKQGEQNGIKIIIIEIDKQPPQCGRLP
jgi:hypothetical protein